MEIVDVKRMFENHINKRQSDLISENIEHSLSMSFYGYKDLGNSKHRTQALYFFPSHHKLEEDVLTITNETYYGKIKIYNDSFYVCNLDVLPEDCNYIDVFSSPYDAICDNFILTLGDRQLNTKFGYLLYDKNNGNHCLIHVGRIARVGKTAWKFHPMFQEMDREEMAKNYHVEEYFRHIYRS